MNKNDLVRIVAAQVGISQEHARHIVDALFDSIVEALAAGSDISLRGFGSFLTKQRAARIGRNPQTGAVLQIKPATSVAFKPGTQLKDSVQDSSPAAADGPGARSPGRKAAGRKKAGGRGGGSRREMAMAPPSADAGPPPPRHGERERKQRERKRKVQTPPGERYLQACVEDAKDDGEKVQRLKADADYRACVFIGARRKDWLGLGEAIDEPAPKPDGSPHKLRVVFWEPDLCPQPQMQELDLWPTGDTEICRFPFRTRGKDTTFAGRIAVYHGNRNLQAGVLVGEVSGGKLDFILNAAPLPRFVGLAGRRDVGTSVILDGNQAGECYLCMVAEGKERVATLNRVVPDPAHTDPIDVNVAKESSLEGLKKEIGRCFTAITTAPEAYAGLEKPATRKLLCNLAQRGAGLRDYLRDHTDMGTVLDNAQYIQIVRAKADAFFPLEYLYAGTAPEDDAKICDGAADAGTARKALSSGRCCGAYDKDDENTICPLKFWSLSKVIERHAHLPEHTRIEKELQMRSAGPSERNRYLSPLTSVVLAVSEKADAAGQGTVAKLQDRLGKITHEAPVEPAGNWGGLAKKVAEKRPHLLILLPHHAIVDTMDALEIGGQERKVGLVRSRHVRPEGDDSLAPVVLLIGCDTSAARVDFDNCVTAFQKHGASIIVSTIGSLLGREAGPATEALVEQLQASMSKEASTFGEALLATRRKLLAAGMPMVLGLTSYGDADWLLGKAKAGAQAADL